MGAKKTSTMASMRILRRRKRGGGDMTGDLWAAIAAEWWRSALAHLVAGDAQQRVALGAGQRQVAGHRLAVVHADNGAALTAANKLPEIASAPAPATTDTA